MSFSPLSVKRETAETVFAIELEPRQSVAESLPIPNRLLSHFVDHFAQASGINVRLTEDRWPGSWRFDHVLCEDLGQAIGRGLLEIHDRRAASDGVDGRASVTTCMDDDGSSLALSFERRPRVDWDNPGGIDVDGFVDSWYEEGDRQSSCYGTNLRQFVDGLVLGAQLTVAIRVERAENLHHLYEVVFRALGDAVGQALGTRTRLAGDSSGLARSWQFEVSEISS